MKLLGTSLNKLSRNALCVSRRASSDYWACAGISAPLSRGYSSKTPTSTQRRTNELVWFITGSSTGFGNQFVTSALARGDKVIATARPGSISKLKTAVAEQQNLKLMELDVTSSEEKIEEVAKEAVGAWGRVDVVVNNAGNGVAGMLEEGGMHCIMKQFETNVYGPLKVTNAFLPYMRERRSGTVVFMGSRSGWQTNIPMRGFYASSKAAIHALAETYSAELKQFNIETFCFMPGAFRTPAIRMEEVTDPASGKTRRGLTSEMLLAPKSFDDYDSIRQFANARWAELARKEPGNPVKAVETMVDFVRGEGCVEEYVKSGKELPHSVFLGSDCVENVEMKAKNVLENIREWREVAVGTDFEDGS